MRTYGKAKQLLGKYKDTAARNVAVMPKREALTVATRERVMGSLLSGRTLVIAKCDKQLHNWLQELVKAQVLTIAMTDKHTTGYKLADTSGIKCQPAKITQPKRVR